MADQVDVVVGVLSRAHGIKGEVNIELRTDEPGRRFQRGARFVVAEQGRTLTIESVRWAGERLLVRFEELPDRTAVEAARGWVLTAKVDADELPEDDDEFYDRQLVGLRALNSRGQQVGVVTEVIHLPAQDLLAIDVAGVERLVPFVEALVPHVDLAGGTLTVADVEGLLSESDD